MTALAREAAVRLVQHRGSGEVNDLLTTCTRVLDATNDPGWTVAGLSSRFKMTKAEVRLVVHGRVY